MIDRLSRLPRVVLVSALVGLFGAAFAAPAKAPAATTAPAAPLIEGEYLPTGMRITPSAAPGSTFESLNPGLAAFPEFTVGQVVDAVLSVDRNTLLVLTSGYNRNYDSSGTQRTGPEFVFVFDVSTGKAIQKQVLAIPNSFNGLAISPAGTEFYVSGGVDDVVHVFTKIGDTWSDVYESIPLGHGNRGVGLSVRPMAAGMDITADGAFLVVANYQNDSVSLIDVAARAEVAELDLRPGILDPAKTGEPGGTYPFGVAVKGDGKAYVTSVRDREVLVLSLGGGQLALEKRIATEGQPNKMAFNGDESRLYVASDNSDTVLVLDTATDTIVETIGEGLKDLVLPGKSIGRGLIPNNVMVSHDGSEVYVSLGGINAIAVLAVTPEGHAIKGLVPTGHYPTAIATSPDGSKIFVFNGKSNAGPNPDACRDTTSIAPGSSNECNAANQYVWMLKKAGLLTLARPTVGQLGQLSRQVAYNSGALNQANAAKNEAMMAFLRKNIKHVIYVVKENRTYDQVFGAFETGNGDPELCLFPEPIAPNHYALARNFVLFDNFYDSGETSNTGWNWTTAAMSTDFTEKTAPVNYAGRGLQYDWEGSNRNIPAEWTQAERELYYGQPFDPNVLAGIRDVAAPDGPEGEAGSGYVWDAALRAGKTVRNYGCYGGRPGAARVRKPFEENEVQVIAYKRSLLDSTAPFFRFYDMSYPDYWRYYEWAREFDLFVEAGEMPNFQIVRVPHDHFGNYTSALDRVDTPDTQMADNDYAVGLMVEKIAKSPFKDNTLVFILEDDAQNGADHVDAHRSLLLVAGPYVKRNVVDSKHYTTVSVIRTMLEILGAEPLGIYDGLAEPMAGIFDPSAKAWDFTAIVPEVLRTTDLPLPERTERNSLPDTPYNRAFSTPRGTPESWEAAMSGQDFSTEDNLDEPAFNRALWHGLMGDAKPYPAVRHGRDMSENREALLDSHEEDVVAGTEPAETTEEKTASVKK